jgi:hypothetical protein
MMELELKTRIKRSPEDLSSDNIEASLVKPEKEYPLLVRKAHFSSGESIFSTAEEVRGHEGQICQSKKVLDTVMTRYVHISTNTSKGGATGKIKAEYMICECRYNHGN